MRKRLTLSALLAAGALTLTGCGGDGDGASGGDSAKGNATDRAFVAEMLPHHESAVQMASIAQQRGGSAFVKGLADDIVRTQEQEIATMRREDSALAAAGVKKGSLGVSEHAMGMEMDAASLKTAEPFDRAFLEMMLPHHKGAVEMAKIERAKGADPELEQLALAIIDAQQREIAGMQNELTRAQ